jgi:poly(3-hydroxybutyrate) depolymerase
MLYDAYEMQRSLLAGASKLANFGAGWLQNPANPMAYSSMGPIVASALDVFAHAAAPRGKPEFGLDTIEVDGKECAGPRGDHLSKPFGQLKHFAARASRAGRNCSSSRRCRAITRPCCAARSSGCCRATTSTSPTGATRSWCRLIDAGRFDLDDYIDYLIEFLEHIGERMGERRTCSRSASRRCPAFAAAALMSRQEPVAAAHADHDGRADRHAQGADRGQHAGDAAAVSLVREQCDRDRADDLSRRGRKVYPGFLQLAGFMTMNLGSHLISHWEMFKHLVVGDEEGADATQRFYDEYRSVCDMTAEFYLQTVDVVFQRHLLPKGEMMHRGAASIRPRSATRPARDRGRARRYFRHRPDQGGARHRDQAARLRPRSSISSPRMSAITASSTAANGATPAPRSRPWSRSSSPLVRRPESRPRHGRPKAQLRAVLVRGLGDLGGIVVADLGRQRGHQHQRALQAGLILSLARLDADHACCR